MIRVASILGVEILAAGSRVARMSRGPLSRVQPGHNDDLAARMDALKCKDESAPVSEADDSEGTVG